MNKEVEYYCLDCNTTICSYCKLLGSHSRNEMANHELVDVHEQYIKLNPEKEEYYCLDCNTTICSYCKLLGSHSRNEMANHELVDVHEQYIKLNPEKEDSMKHLNEKIKKGQETISKLKFQIHQLRENISSEAEKQLEYEAEKDYNNAQLVSTDDIHLNITKLNLLTVMRDIISNSSEYYTLRQNLVKNVSVPEFIYVWFTYKRIVESLIKNIEYFNMKNKYPDKSNYNLTKFNEFKLISFNVEDGNTNKEKNKEEVTKVSADKRKQVFDKAQQKLNLDNTRILKDMIKRHKQQSNQNHTMNSIGDLGLMGNT
eukprot:CAMPEP_0170537200 /NCGR_PEP_ID=MMETSP0209-20121228/102576_1 /TAXON_ID=665100 ORGANISM="Litonotus pictus, Strain P1" /NCGR_SAMPLE_ID=MMETSP0209 /ASSEMBLY_ACC=CAM_ASM_000301 /LENGTH=312 /DNA_ID=CAMNT_0010838659 /DNA_START=733 /DNA_END=1667 /DNA_ORIENTATION=-